MKKTILASIAVSVMGMLSGNAIASQAGNSYLMSEGTNKPIMSGAQLCWHADGDRRIEEVCGDVKPEPKAAVVQEVVQVEKIVVVPKVEAEVKINTTLLFNFNSSELTEEAKRELNNLHNKYLLKDVKIVGHSDQFGPNGYNNTLSVKRAQVVKNYLEFLGVKGSSVVLVEGVGKTQPVVECKPLTIKCEAPNRRVNIAAEAMARK